MNDIWDKQIHVKNLHEYVKSCKKDTHNPFCLLSLMWYSLTSYLLTSYSVSGAVLGTTDTKMKNSIVPAFINFKLASSVLNAMMVEVKDAIRAYRGGISSKIRCAVLFRACFKYLKHTCMHTKIQASHLPF